MDYERGKVSVVINTYNHVHFIGECVGSVVHQSYPDIEILITDDCSTDGNQEKLKGLAAADRRIRLLFSDRNKGMSANLNKAFRQCRGEYLALIAGDDTMLPGKIEKQVAYLEDHPDCVLCHHDMEVFDSQTGEVLYRFNERFGPPRTLKEHLFFTDWFFRRKERKTIPSSTLARSSYFLQNLWDERFRFYNEVLHGIKNYAGRPQMEYGFVDEVLGRYRVHSGSVSRSTDIRSGGVEEYFMLTGAVYAKHPGLYKYMKNSFDFFFFRHLLHEWLSSSQKADYEKMFLRQAGLLKYLYLKVCRLYLTLKGPGRVHTK